MKITALIKKEILELIRTKRFLIVSLIFITLGVLSPYTAKLLPNILNEINNIAVEVPEPTLFDSWYQFFKSISQLGLVVLVIFSINILLEEFKQSTLTIIIVRGGNIGNVILGKFVVYSLAWMVLLSLAGFVCFLLTSYLWSYDYMVEIILGIFNIFIFGIMLISILIIASVMFKNMGSVLGFMIFFLIFLFGVDMINDLSIFNPLKLITDNNLLILNEISFSDFYKPILVTTAIIISNIVLSIKIFKIRKFNLLN